jgi:hypothetical protein
MTQSELSLPKYHPDTLSARSLEIRGEIHRHDQPLLTNLGKVKQRNDEMNTEEFTNIEKRPGENRWLMLKAC